MARLNPRKIAIVSWVLAIALIWGAQAAQSQADRATQALPNFARVSDTLFRGAQPSEAGFGALQQMGVGIVVNFREERWETSSEKREVESLGMQYVGIPWKGRQTPSNTQIVQFLDLVRANPQTKIFVHCQRGADRTGTMIAAYRIAMERDSVADAISEMYRFHYDHFWLPQLQRYVISLPHLLQTNKQFGAYAPVSTATNLSAAPANP